LPVQVVGQLGWCLGEARAHWKLVTRKSSVRLDCRRTI
jgi:hypothetical protein